MDRQIIRSETFSLYTLCEYAVTLEFDSVINSSALDRITRFDARIHQHPFDGFKSSVPAYTTLTVFFDPLEVMRSATLDGLDGYQRVSAYLKKLAALPMDTTEVPSERVVTIPVCYGGEFGPDLEEVADMNGLTPTEVIRLHSGATYRVHLVGFTPGFPYLSGLPNQLVTPRRKTPRRHVPRGSVGIAGSQTGIYPQDTPGGWQIIGRTWLPLFDENRPAPALLKAGDRIIFQPIPHEQFMENHSSHADTDY